MTSRLFSRLSALLLGLLLFALASCSGGSSTTTPVNPGDVGVGTNEPPPLLDNPDGGTVYDGQPSGPGTQPPTVTQPAQPGTWDFGDLIYHVPIDSEGKARVTVDTFAPGQKAAFVAINMNQLFLDAHTNASGDFPGLPASSYSFEADQVEKGTASAKGGSSVVSPADLTPQSDYALDNSSLDPLSPLSIYEREARARGEVPFSVEATKTASLLQKGEVLTFINVPQRTPKLPPILPGPKDPDKDVSKLLYPQLYQSQDGRLVAVGQHCLIFLSTELNDGHPDNVRFTQARLNRMAAEFDNNIFPVATAAFGPVKNYDEAGVYRDLDRSIILTGDDFDAKGNLTTQLPGVVDFRISSEGKILIFIDNGDEGGFFTYGAAINDKGLKTTVGSTLYLGGDNFPPNDNDFNAAFSVMAHEFQHKLYHDNGLPERATSHDWFNEGLSQLSLYICGYTPNSGRLIHWAVDTQLSQYLQAINASPLPMDANPYEGKNVQYGAGLLFFLYMFEHYDPGVGNRIYQAASKEGISDRIKLCERGAQYTVDGVTYQDTFQQLFAKYAIANFVDGINSDSQSQFDKRFHYDTIDLRGTINLSTGTIQLPGVRVSTFPQNGAYPAIANDRLVLPWSIDYLVFGNGDGRDLDVQFSADQYYKFYMLPVHVETDPVTGNPSTNKVTIAPNIQMGY